MHPLPWDISKSYERVVTKALIYLHDILISGNKTDEHLQHFTIMLIYLQDVRLCLKTEKCEFLSCSVVYLYHFIDAEGVYLTADKIDAIWQKSTSQNVT